jgi:hypothetical protein
MGEENSPNYDFTLYNAFRSVSFSVITKACASKSLSLDLCPKLGEPIMVKTGNFSLSRHIHNPNYT